MAREETQKLYQERPHVLVVDDDRRICDLVCRYLYDHDFVAAAANGAAQARDLMGQSAFDVLVVDVMMPGETGLEFMQDLRAKGYDLPALMLTALGELNDKQAGFDAGVDDYLPKPFEPQELVMRLKALLRRGGGAAPVQGGHYLVGDVLFDPLEGVLQFAEGSAVKLTEAELALLVFMAGRAGQALSRTALMEHCGIGSERAVDVQIARLRQKLEPDAGGVPRYLQTVRGKGYILRHCRRKEGA